MKQLLKLLCRIITILLGTALVLLFCFGFLTAVILKDMSIQTYQILFYYATSH